MGNFIDFKFINESLDSNFEVHRDKDFEDTINKDQGDRINSAHTAVMQSDHMKKHSTSVIRMRNAKHGHFEYHIHSDNLQNGDRSIKDRKVGLHVIKIIHDDAKDKLSAGHRIMVQTTHDGDYPRYLSLGKRLAIETNKKVFEVGHKPLTLAPHINGKSFVIEQDLSLYSDIIGRQHFMLYKTL